MSAGRRAAECVSSGDCGSSKPGRSFSGWKPALSSQAKSTSRTALWRRVRSPPATQVAAWWLWRSSTPSQSGHQQSWTASGTPSRKRSSAEKTAGSSRVRPDGTAARKARPPRPASEWSTAFSTRLACVSCTCQLALSSRSERSCCLAAKAASRDRLLSAGRSRHIACSAPITEGDARTAAAEKAQSMSAQAARLAPSDAK